MAKRAIVVGYGRVGSALATRLRKAHWSVTIVRRSSRLNALPDASLCFLTVPDAQIADVARQMHRVLSARCALIHCAGAKTLKVFGPLKRPLGSFHPLVAISDASTRLEGASVAISATDGRTERALRAIAKTLKMKALRVSEQHRERYHASAVMSAGLVVSLFDAAVETMMKSGVPRREAINALLPLAQSALNGVRERGTRAAMTGPVVRGDVDVVRSHLAVLPKETRAMYRALAANAVELAAPAKARRRLKMLLRG